MKFRCNVCGEYKEICKNVKEGFSIVAYEEMIMISDINEIPENIDDEFSLPVRRKAPEKNDVCIARVTFPFDFETGEKFNVLFQPPMSYYNGWDEDYSDEVYKSAVLMCCFESVIMHNERTALIYLKIEDVIFLPDFMERFPEFKCRMSFKEKKEIYKSYNDLWVENFDDRWTMYSWSAQGDLGWWELIYTDNYGRKHLFLSCKWDFHSEDIQCGNIVFDE